MIISINNEINYKIIKLIKRNNKHLKKMIKSIDRKIKYF